MENKENQESTECKEKKPQDKMTTSTIDKASFEKAYQEAIFSRKQESFNNFQSWEAKRKLLAQNHKNITNNMMTRIEKKLEWIDAGIDSVIKFFRDRIAQEESYVKIMTQGLPQLGKAFSHETHPEIFGNIAKAMTACDEYHKKQSQNSATMAKFISSNILDNLIISSEKEYRKKLDKIRDPVIDAKKKVTAVGQEIAKVSQKYNKLYEELQKKGKATDKEKDLFKKELECVIVGQEELKVIKAFAKSSMEFLNEVVKYLIVRLANIQKALTLYFQKCAEIYGKNASNIDGVIKIFGSFKSDSDIEQYFAVQNTFSQEEIQYFIERSGKSEIGYGEVYHVLVNLSTVKPPEQRPLLLKEWKAHRETGGLLKSWKPAYVMVTADANVLVVEKNAEGDFENIDLTLKMQRIKIQKNDERRDRSIVDLAEISPGLILNSKKSVTLKFDNEDMAEEFLHYVYNYFNSSILSNAQIQK